MEELSNAGLAIHSTTNTMAFVSQYVLVYGTLRLNQSNWRNYLKDSSDYIGTYKLKKWTLRVQGLPLGFYTGHDSDYLVVDLFKIKGNPAEIYATNYMLDQLEGTHVPNSSNYRQVILTIDTPELEQPVVVKIYEGGFNIAEQLYATKNDYSGDWLKQFSQHKDYLFINQ